MNLIKDSVRFKYKEDRDTIFYIWTNALCITALTVVERNPKLDSFNYEFVMKVIDTVLYCIVYNFHNNVYVYITEYYIIAERLLS